MDVFYNKLLYLGGLACCLSTFPYLADFMSPNIKFYTALIGQGLSGIATPFVSFVPTKISQGWFNEQQRTLATILLSLSSAIGYFMGSMFTPMIVQEESQVPIMNIIWFIPAGIGSILTLWKVHFITVYSQFGLVKPKNYCTWTPSFSQKRNFWRSVWPASTVFSKTKNNCRALHTGPIFKF